MTNATLYDEIQSIRAFLSLTLTGKEIRTERPVSETEDYDILVESPTEVTSEMRGTYMTNRTMPVTVQWWTSSRMEAEQAAEQLDMIFRCGTAFGTTNAFPSKMPVWDFSSSEPDLATAQPLYWMKVADLSIHTLPADSPGDYVVACDLQLKGYRVTKPIPTSPVIEFLGDTGYVPPA